MSSALLTIASVIAVSLLSLSGALFFLLNERSVRRCLLPLVGFSTGALLGDVFIHIIPEMAEGGLPPVALAEGGGKSLDFGSLIILVGIILSFVIEKMIHWRHCHVMPVVDDRDGAGQDSVRPDVLIVCDHHHVGLMNLIGDGIHNFIDGALIAGSFLVSAPIGVATTVAVMFHEIPQEIGDFAVLLHSGYGRKKALLFNVLAAGAALAGAVLILLAHPALPLIGAYLLPLAAGNFIYIAGADLIPELHKEVRLTQAALQLLSMVGGIAVMYALTAL